jgi:NADPH-dependent 2,4-dienoyl-CoA reductase/sulfur reductase-like enzyme/nitrite reductase/ring-hydroxylating ferredoxin subunit
MGGQQTELTGPDFTQGVAVADLRGGTLLGHARGEPVLLAQSGGELFAVSATCTHYSGPLAEGLVVGDTVRCPWHHACFSLRTGEPVRAPALNPIACWKVERRGDRVFVGEKLPPAEPRTAPAPAPKSVVIVGGGAAGNAAAEMLRREGYGGPITLVSADPSPPVDRPNLSKDYLAGTAPEEWIPLRDAGFYAQHRIELRLGVRATALDVASRRVTLSDGTSLEYGALLLATGAEPIRLSVPGADLPHVHTLRSLADSRAIIAALGGAKRAVVVGASFIGLEVAASLRTRGLEVHVVAPERVLFEKVMGQELGEFVRTLHESHGVVFHLGHVPSEVTRSSVRLDDGEELPADIVVAGIGVRPNIALAEAAGLAIDRGVRVSETLETSAPGVFAAGDIARWPDPHTGESLRIEHWVVAERQGQIAARNMLGRRERFDAVPFFWSQHYDVPIAYVGHASGWDRAIVTGSIAERSCVVGLEKQGKIRAVLSIYRDRESLEAEVALERGDEAALRRILEA